MGREKRFWEMFSDGKFCEATLELARAGAIKKKRKKRDRERHYSSESLAEKTWPCR